MNKPPPRMLSQKSGHSLLESVIAAAIFIMIAVALSGVWVMYGSALAKSAEHMAANHLARSVTEGLIANGYQWLKDNETTSVLPQTDYTIKRSVRGRTADIKYNVTYKTSFNTGALPSARTWSFLSQDVCQLTVSVRWHSDHGDRDIDSGTYNNEVAYRTFVYKGAIN